MTSARTHMCAIRAVICSPASSDVITNMPNCDAAFDVPLYAAAAALTPCSRPTLSTKHDFARYTISRDPVNSYLPVVVARPAAKAILPMCEYAPSPFSEFWTRLTVRLDLCARLFSMPTALALPLYAYALTRIVGYPRHEVRNEDRLPRVAFTLLAVAPARRGT